MLASHSSTLKTALLAVAIVLGSAPLVSADAAGPWTLSASPSVTIPLGSSTFSTSFGGVLGVEYAPPTLSPFSFSLGAAYSGGGLQAYAGQTASNALSEGLLMGGVALRLPIVVGLSARLFAAGGLVVGALSNADGQVYPYGIAEAGAGLNLQLDPQWGLRFDEAYLYKTGLYGGLSSNLSLAWTLPEAKTLMEKIRPSIITITDLKLASVFPILKGYYDDHPVGSIVVSNTSKDTARNITVSMIIRQFMDASKDCATIPALGPGESREVPVYALFNGSILDVTEMTKVSAEIRVDYSDSVAPSSQTKTATMLIYDRNALTWDDNNKAAAFVSGKDPWVLALSNNVTAAVKDLRNTALNRNLQTAVAFHAALRLYGLSYVVNPKSPFAQAQANPEIVDFVKFPRQTLAFKAGDCSDLSVLYASFFESVGVETAFITIPGHIFMAINLDIDPNDARSQFSAIDDLIMRDGKTWLPIEVTLRGSSLADAWKQGASEWRQTLAAGTADFYPVHEAWKSFAPVGLPADDSSVENVQPRSLSGMYTQEMAAFVDQELNARLAVLNGSIPAGVVATPKLLNSRGVLKARYGRLSAAESDFLAATKAKPFAPALVNLGNIAALASDNAGAVRYYQQAAKLTPDNAALFMNLARAQRALGHVAEADTATARARQLDPQLVERGGPEVPVAGSATRAAEASAPEVLWLEQ